MTTEVATQQISTPAVFTERDAFELAVRQAKVYAASTLVPQEYRENAANCMIALNMAKRIGADPLMTMQNLYIVHGRPGWSAQFLIAAWNQCGRYTTMRFEWASEQGKKDWGCRAYATERATGERVEGPWITWAMVDAEGWGSKNGSKWKSMPTLMFHYRAAAFLVRTHAPEIAMGLQTDDEIRDVIDVTPSRPNVASVADLNASLSVVPDEQPAAMTYADLADMINGSDTPEELDYVRSLLTRVPDKAQQSELAALIIERAKAL